MHSNSSSALKRSKVEIVDVRGQQLLQLMVDHL